MIAAAAALERIAWARAHAEDILLESTVGGDVKSVEEDAERRREREHHE
jgi:hypothetical protein